MKKLMGAAFLAAAGVMGLTAAQAQGAGGVPADDWAHRVVKHVGNYGASFAHNVDSSTLLKIARGQDALWASDGLPYVPPIR
ncbi:hypothetical protein [Bosea sp. (in: a-proteobacteria)]|uniref:hypothetical protein n=1 Tax=Bosea sp. (in: a-proteobacteria) TaxID=1871050 RepID=UPI002FC947AB